MQIHFGARANAGQAVAAQELARTLYGENTAANTRPELTFFKHVKGLRDFGATVDEVRTDGKTMNDTLESLSAAGELPASGNVDVLYFWRFPSALLARVGEGFVKHRIRKSETAAGERSEVRRSGDKLLMRTRIEAEALTK